MSVYKRVGRTQCSGAAGIIFFFFMRAEGQRQAHQSFSENGGSGEQSVSAEEERGSLEDPLSADGGVFAGQRQLGRL